MGIFDFSAVERANQIAKQQACRSTPHHFQTRTIE
jgi:hypothetical protein